jgi:hypothetical protein
MHGLINRSIQCFLRDTHGAAVWSRLVQEAGLAFDSFEPMLTYDPVLTDAVIDAAARVLDRPRDCLMEDLGTYLVSHPNVEALRRLLRFGGVNFTDFLHSLEDLPGRGRLALPDLDLPSLHLLDHGGDIFTLSCHSPIRGVGHVMIGLLRAMADDYGALVFLNHESTTPEAEVISIHVIEAAFATGRRFDLAVLGAG